MTGTHILTSGNTIKWKLTEAGDRAGIRASFVNPPSEADIAETRTWVTEQKPKDATMEVTIVADSQTAVAVLDRYLYGGHRN